MNPSRRWRTYPPTARRFGTDSRNTRLSVLLEHDAERQRDERKIANARCIILVEDVVIANLGERPEAAQIELHSDAEVHAEIAVGLFFGLTGVELHVVVADAADEIWRRDHAGHLKHAIRGEAEKAEVSPVSGLLSLQRVVHAIDAKPERDHCRRHSDCRHAMEAGLEEVAIIPGRDRGARCDAEAHRVLRLGSRSARRDNENGCQDTKNVALHLVVLLWSCSGT